MAKFQVSPLALPAAVVLPELIKINPNIPRKSEMTPFSAVVPDRVLAVSRIQVETSLETIYEDETFITTTTIEDINHDCTDDGLVAVAVTSDFKAPPAAATLLSSSPSTTCFLELHKRTFSSEALSPSNFQCAN